MATVGGEIWLTDDAANRVLLEQLGLLRAIAEAGSISAAAKTLGISYKTAWDRLERLNNLSKLPLLLRASGGSKGGGSQLTDYGRQLLAGFEELEKQHQETLASASERAEKLNDINISISRKAGAEGKLYGSIGTVDIVEAVVDQSGVDLAKHEVRLPEGPIRDIGEYKLAIQLHADVSATITVNVISEEES